MGYWLGIDVGNTVTAAAVCRAAEPAAVVALGSGSVVVPSVVDPSEPGRLVVGQAAQQRAVTDPDRVVRAFTGRIGDEVPMVIGGQAYTAAQLTAMLARWVVDQVAAQQGAPADAIVMTHPASWGDYKRAVLAEALTAEGLAQVRLCPDPDAAAAAAGYAGPGRTLAVYDLGGTTFDATVIRATGTGQCTVLGTPQHLLQLGGADFDDAVFGHLLAAVPALAELDADDPATLAATAALRRQCTQATQALSADTEVTIPVTAPGIQTQVRLHRAEFDDMIRPQLSETLQALRRALHTAQLDPHQLDAVLLVGGSCRIPLVAQLVSADLDQPVNIDADPTTTIARGAAILARGATLAIPAGAHPADTHPADVPQPHPTPPPSDPAPQPQRPSLTAIPLDVEPAEARWRRTNSRRATRIAVASGLAVLTAAGVASVSFLMARSEPNPASNAGTPAPGAPPAPSTPAPGPPPVPDPGGTVAGPETGSEVGSGTAGSQGIVRRTSPAAPNQAAGGPANPPPVGAPPPSWVTTYTWTTSWSNPPPTTSLTTTPAATTTASPTPPAPTTQPSPPTSTATAPAPTTSPSKHRS
jgi:molecular chaperone DnaK